MSVFTTVAKVKSLFRNIAIEADTGDPDLNTAITTEELQDIIDEQEAVIKARISNCYDITMIGSESAQILGIVARYMSAQVVKGILQITTEVSDGKVQVVTQNWGKMGKELLEKICPEANCGKCTQPPTLPLPDTPLSDVNRPDGSSIFFTENYEQVFKKYEDNW